jgi:hypothetical protein
MQCASLPVKFGPRQQTGASANRKPGSCRQSQRWCTKRKKKKLGSWPHSIGHDRCASSLASAYANIKEMALVFLLLVLFVVVIAIVVAVMPTQRIVEWMTKGDKKK